jgi:hypothetical protein
MVVALVSVVVVVVVVLGVTPLRQASHPCFES